MNTPSDLFYSKEHEWVRVEETKAYVGITDFAQHSLGDVVYVELPEVGAKVAAGDEAGVVESVKAASPIYSPVAGEIVETNANLEDAPQAINEDPYGQFVFVVELDAPFEKGDLLDATEYAAICEE